MAKQITSGPKLRWGGLTAIITTYWWMPIANRMIFGFTPTMDNTSIAIIAVFASLYIWSEFILWPTRARRRGIK